MEAKPHYAFPLALLLLCCNGLMISCLAQQCGSQAGGALCADNLCCSQYGYCGSTSDYCGDGCQSQCATSSSGGDSSSGSGVSSIITSDIFNQFLSQNSGSGCPSNGFYTYDAFISAAAAYSGFGTTGSTDDQKRELAAFFANVAHETGSGCYVEEINKATYCDADSTVQCAAGQQYYGRGPLQITWQYNYYAAGQEVGFDGVNNPGIVASDPTVSFKTALWYWMTQQSPTCHAAITGGLGFGATINAINGGLECGSGANQDEQQDRISLYTSFCSTLSVDPGSNLTC